MKKIVLLVLTFTIVLACKSDRKNIPKQFDYGGIAGNSYSNEYFNFDLKFNPEWNVLNRDEINKVNNIGVEFASGDNKEFERMLDASQVNMAPLFYIFKRDLYDPTPSFNPSLVINAENIKDFPHVKHIDEYLKESKKVIMQSAMNVTILEDITTKTLNGKEYSYIKMNNNTLGQNITQEYYALLDKNFALNFVFSYTSEEDKKSLYNVMNSINFK